MVVWQPACAPQIQDLSLDLVVTVVGFVDAGQPLDLGAVIELGARSPARAVRRSRSGSGRTPPFPHWSAARILCG
jgi:hypothetical protein